jgi:hypothetical protein
VSVFPHPRTVSSAAAHTDDDRNQEDEKDEDHGAGGDKPELLHVPEYLVLQEANRHVPGAHLNLKYIVNIYDEM